MAYYDVQVTTGTTLRFQVEANSEDEARAIMGNAMNEYPDEIYDAIDAYGEVDTSIVDIAAGNKWDDPSEAAPGVFY